MMLEQGRQRHMAGDLEGAAACYEKALAQEPGNVDALNLLGVVHLQTGDPARAAGLFRDAIKIDAGQAGVFNNLGQALQAQGDPGEAAACYEKALAIEPANADFLNNMGTALHELGRLGDARAAYDAAMKAESEDPEIHHNRGVLLHDFGDFDGARSAFERALTLDPGMETTYLSLGGTLNEIGERDGAIRAYTLAIEASPFFTDAHDALNLLYWDSNDRDRMNQSYRAVCQALPDSPEAHCNLGRALIASQKPGEAEAALRRALDLGPGFAEAHHQLGRALAMENRFEDAAAEHREAVRLDGTDAIYLEELGYTLIRAGAYADAAEVLWRGHALNPRRSGILAGLTIAMNETGDPRIGDIVDYDALVTSMVIDCPAPFGDLGTFNDALHAEIEKRHTDHPPPPGQTMHGGTQIPTALFASPDGLTAAVKEALTKTIAEYIGGLEPDDSHPFLRFVNPRFRFTGAWSTILHGAGYDGSHIHNEGWLSGVYYVKVPDIAEDKWRAGEGCLQIGEPPPAFVSERNRTERLIRPEAGMAVFFPSYFWHGVKPFTDEGGGNLRHSIAFDIL